MGIGIFGMRISSSSYDPNSYTKSLRSGNPDPYNFKVLEAEQRGSYIVLKVNYPDCKNYEGNKILVYKSTLKDIINQKSLDPHFSNNEKFISPIARFTPDAFGWKNALAFCSMLNGQTYNGFR